MRRIVFNLLLVLATGALAWDQEPKTATDCDFKVPESRSNGKAALVTGPEEVVRLIHVIEQPDSPIQILEIDLTGTILTVDNERANWQPKCTIKVRNRSDRTVEWVSVSIGGVLVGSQSNDRPINLPSGHETEFKGCGGGRSRTARVNEASIFVLVSYVSFDTCAYEPSTRVPIRLVKGARGFRNPLHPHRLW